MIRNKHSKNSIPAARFILTVAGILALTFSPAGAQLVINDSQTAEPGDEFWNPWDYSNADISIGLGENASGELFVPPGAEVLFETLHLGALDPTSSGYLEINGEGALVRSETASGGDSAVRVGHQGYGEILITNGGRLVSRQAWVGVQEGSVGKITVTGPDSVWTSPGGWSIRIGHLGEGTLEVLDGATMGGAEFEEKFANFFVGNISETDLDGNVLRAGTGQALVDGGSSIQVRGNSYIGNNRGAEGTMIVRGGGSLFTIGEFIHVGSSGTGTLLIEDGGTVVTGTDSTNAALSIGAATRAADRDYDDVPEERASGMLHIKGAGSLMEVASFIHVGRNHDGILLLEDGGTLRTPSNFRVGRESAATGGVTVRGEGTLLEVGTWVHVGADGKGTMLVTDNARVDVLEIDFTGGLSVGRETGAEGFLHVSQGGLIDMSGNLNAGFGGQGELLVSEGGRINVTKRPETTVTGHFYVARGAGGEGLATVTGEDSRIDAEGLLLVGAHSGGEFSGGLTALLRVEDEGMVSAEGGWVRGADSAIELAGGHLVLTDEPLRVVDSSLTGHGSITGSLVIDTEATVQGSEGGLNLKGFLSGTGTAGNLTVAGVRSFASDGPLILNGIGFSADEDSPLVHIVIDAAADVLLTADAATDYSGADLVVEFDLPLPPATTLTFPLFGGEAALNFASVTTPAGWGLQDGVLVHTGEVPVGTPFEDWAAGFGLTGDDALPGANPSGDGFSNAAKFAFGASPTMAVPALAEVEASEEGVTLRWNRLTAAGATYRIERSPTLEPGSWEEVEGAVPTLVADPGEEVPEGYERVEWTAVPAEGKAFYRVVSVLEPSLLP